MKKTFNIAFIFISSLLISCSTTNNRTGKSYPDYPTGRYPGGEYPNTGKGPTGKTYPGTDKTGKPGSGVYSYKELKIPKGHLPPPGQCKVWFPGVPPGHQPPAQSCATAMMNKPVGAWLITHESNRYKVITFEQTDRGIIDIIRYFNLR